MKKALVIGAGVSGLASAIRLAARGYSVEVHESAESPGGKMGELHKDGFRWDTGPSLFTWPGLAEELFRFAGRSMSDYVPYRALQQITRYQFPGGEVVEAPAEAEAFAIELERKLGEPAGNTLAYLKDCRQLFELTRPVFLEQEISIRKALSKPYLSAYPRLHLLKAWTSLHRYHARVFRTPEVIQLFDRYATYNGSNPYSAPATLRVIAHLEHNEGAYFPLEGMYGLAKGMHKLAMELGVEFRFGSRVEKLVVQDGRVSGAETSKGFVVADYVFSSADVSSPEGFSRRPPLPPSQLSTSAIIFYLGMQGEYPGLGLHNIFFSKDYRSEFSHLFEKGELSDDLSVYVFISSKMVPTDAPGGCENWFVMVNAPVDRGQDWEAIADRARARVLTKLEQELGLSIAGNLLSESRLIPPDLASNTNAWKGALYGPHSNHTMSAFRRHPVQGRYPNLFHTGGSVHPGGGIPLCLLSARIATEKIIER